MKDTVRSFGWKLKPEIVRNYKDIKDVEFFFEKDFISTLVKGALFTINKMRIREETIIIPSDKGWDDLKDTLTTYCNRHVDYFKQAFGAQLNYTSIFPLKDESNAGFKPRYIVYFYDKALQLPQSISDTDEIEKQLDVANWFSVELQEQMLTSNYNIVYHVSGGQKQ